jgi:hypothetical protein
MTTDGLSLDERLRGVVATDEVVALCVLAADRLERQRDEIALLKSSRLQYMDMCEQYSRDLARLRERLEKMGDF